MSSPCTLTVWLDAPVDAVDAPHLDALAAHAAWLRSGAPAITERTHPRDIPPLRLPILPVRALGHTVWLATAAEQAEPQVLRWRAWAPRSELRKALKLVFGRDARIGEAAVESWEVEEGDHGPLDCLVDHATGRARRHLPAAWLVGHATRRGAVRAPYWHPGLQEWVAGVGDLVQLRPEVLEIVGAMKLPPRR